jgi:circadian clock protein KaiC
LLAAIRHELRTRGASLLVVDGTSTIEAVGASALDFARFVSQLQTTSQLLGCTTLLLTNFGPREATAASTQADGLMSLGLDPIGARDLRTLRVVKLRGAEHLLGRHSLAISGAGVAVFPRLEAVVATTGLDKVESAARLSTGIAGLDTMLGGGLLPATSTLVIGPPGSGKTLLALHFLAEGAARGERGLIATFHEQRAVLTAEAAQIGLDLSRPMADGVVRVEWRPPLEVLPDAWAAELLAAIDEHRPLRVVIDALTDVERLVLFPERVAPFVAALAGALRDRSVTAVIAAEIPTIAGPSLTVPVPAASATMDNGVLVRQVATGPVMRRAVSVLKARRSVTDPVIREFSIGPSGIVVGEPFPAVGVLTGLADLPAGANARPDTGSTA